METMFLTYNVTFIPMKKEDYDNGYPCAGIVVGKHSGYLKDGKYFCDKYGVATKDHLFSILMIGTIAH